jgi:hypothetical protein
MEKRAMILLVISSLLVIISIASYFALISQDKKPNSYGETNIISTCLRRIAREGLKMIGRQGMLEPEVYMTINDTNVAYFYLDGHSYFPKSIHILEQELSNYIKKNSYPCFNEYEEYIVEDSNSVVFFDQDYAQIHFSYPVIINGTIFDDYNASIKFSFLDIYEVSNEIVKRTEENPEWIDTDLLTGKMYIARIYTYSNNTRIYEITKPYGLESEPYSYRFAIKV